MTDPNREHTPERRRLRALGVFLLGGVTLLLSTGINCDDHIVGHGVPLTNTCLRDPPLTWDNYGDYIIMTVDGEGRIQGWTPPEFDPDAWEEY